MESEEQTEDRPIADFAFPEDLPTGWYWNPEIGTDGAVTYAAAEVPAEESRSSRIRDMQRRQSANPLRSTSRVGLSAEDPAIVNDRLGEALYARMNPRHQLSDAARPYFGLSLPEIGRDILRRSGQTASGLGASDIITRALHTTSDFSIILGDAVNRTLREAYGPVPSGVQTLARSTTARDFRAKHRINLGEFPALEPVSEAGEFTSGTMAETSETYKLRTFGRIIAISRQAMVNDDLGAFADMSARIGRAARAFEAAQLAALLEANPVMSDGENVFDVAHANLGTPTLATPVALGTDGIAAARLAMRRQTGLDGELIDVSPKYLLVPPALETYAERLLAPIHATHTDDVNVFTAPTLSLVVDARLTSDDRWYLAADPAAVDGIEYAHLEGETGPQIESRNGFEVDGVQVKVRLDFGAGWVDHRGWWSSGHA